MQHRPLPATSVGQSVECGQKTVDRAEGSPTMPTLREEFEPLFISPLGCHLYAELCRAAWDGSWSEETKTMIAIADEWLRLPPRTTEINVAAGISYRLKDRIPPCWKSLKRKGDGDVINGCFIMAAHRLGFQIRPTRPNDRTAGAIRGLDCLNAYINISDRSLGTLIAANLSRAVFSSLYRAEQMLTCSKA